MWAAASQMRDHLRLITSYFADLICVWNLGWKSTSGSPLRTSSWRRHYLITTEQAAEGICSWAQQENEVAKTKWWAGRKWHCAGAQRLHTQDIWPLGKIMKAHKRSDGIARIFDIQTATGTVQRPAETLSRVFAQMSSAPECQLNKFIETHTHTHKLNIRMKSFLLWCGDIIYIPIPSFSSLFAFSSSKTLSFSDFHTPNLFPLKLSLDVTSLLGW